MNNTEYNLKLPKLISHNMVLQRNAVNTIWGWALPKKEINLFFMNKNYTLHSDSCGKWNVSIRVEASSEFHSMEIHLDQERIIIHNIAIGDVWICSGQSNMGIPMERVKYRYAKEIEQCENPFIRHFIVPKAYDFNSPNEDFQSGSWQLAHPDTIMNFSAVAYFFGRYLWDKYNIPIGLIKASRGGVPIEGFLSEDVLKEFPEYLKKIEYYREINHVLEAEKQLQNNYDKWFSEVDSKDKGAMSGIKSWVCSDFDDSDWPMMSLPGYWGQQGYEGVNGVLWFRKNFSLDSELSGKKAKLFFGCIFDSDEIFINGQKIGSTGYRYPPRIYDIPENLLKQGENSIVVKVYSFTDEGGFVEDKSYCIEIGNQTIDLSGEWRMQIGARVQALKETVRLEQLPLGAYNGMIAPLHKTKIKGVLWYQGESNVKCSEYYLDFLKNLILDWREKWYHDDLPFLLVQLPNFSVSCTIPVESLWAKIREAQRKALSIPNTGMIVSLDLGEWNDIHPLNKKDIGIRLGKLAQKMVFKDNEKYLVSPVFSKVESEANKIIIYFKPFDEHLITLDGQAPRYFAIAAIDKKFVWAESKIYKNCIILWHDDIVKPKFVRYAWADNPGDINLCNAAGLPASGFECYVD